MLDKIDQFQKEFLQELEKVKNRDEINKLRVKYLGRKGVIKSLLKQLPSLTVEERRQVGGKINQLKKLVEEKLADREGKLDQEQPLTSQGEFLPHWPSQFGRLHPIEWMRQRVLNIFHHLGFVEFKGPHIENDWFNFAGLNIPPGHPARDLWDTLYLNQNDKKGNPLLLRTHTSNIQLRALEKYGVPLRVMAFDRCFRREILDPRHSHTFSQFEVLVVDKGINMNHLKWLSDYFLKEILGQVTESRFRPKYYPFVEPGVGVDAKCVFCNGKGCPICSYSGWFEIAGAGMVHPQVLKNAGIDPNEYSGFAWGFGPDRMLMLMTGVNDIRQFYQGDFQFLKGGR